MKRLALLLFAMALPTGALAEGLIAASYDVSVAGVNVMKLRYSAAFSGNSYDSALNAKTKGMAKWISEYRMDLTAEGTWSKNKFVPTRSSRERKKNGKKSSADFTWTGGVPDISGADMNGAERAAKTLSTGATDPLSMLLSVGFSDSENPCKGKFRVFDGRDVMDTSISGKVNADGTITCKLTAKTVAGRSYERADDKNNVIDVYSVSFKKTAATFLNRGFFMPIEISGVASGQNFTATLDSLDISGASTN